MEIQLYIAQATIGTNGKAMPIRLLGEGDSSSNLRDMPVVEFLGVN